MGGPWDMPVIGCEPGKWLAKGNPETRPTKVAQVAAGGELSPLSLDPSVCVSTRDMLVFLLTSTLLALLLSIFVEVLSRRAEGPGLSSLPTDLGSELGALTAVAWPQSLPGNPSPASSHCRPRPPEISLTQPKFVPGSHPFRIHLTQDTLLQGKWNECCPTWLTVYWENLACSRTHTHTTLLTHKA